MRDYVTGLLKASLPSPNKCMQCEYQSLILGAQQKRAKVTRKKSRPKNLAATEPVSVLLFSLSVH